ncbi:MAG: low molecular weight phosphotyrosine protein phosphatase [Alphaproteobacteria bacterium]|nr:low molecular weight phosphotyrosine protein phosphatase [Alphaproteobacteria bacterium]
MAVSVLFICLGNICRSPLAEGVFAALVEAEGLPIQVDSCGTSRYHVGESPDPGSVRVALAHGVDIRHQRARQLLPPDVERFDYLICMDRSNERHVRAVAGDKRVWRLREFEPQPGGAPDVPDPWGGGADGFAEVYRIVDRCCRRLLSQIVEDHGLTPA